MKRDIGGGIQPYLCFVILFVYISRFSAEGPRQFVEVFKRIMRSFVECYLFIVFEKKAMISHLISVQRRFAESSSYTEGHVSTNPSHDVGAYESAKTNDSQDDVLARQCGGNADVTQSDPSAQPLTQGYVSSTEERYLYDDPNEGAFEAEAIGDDGGFFGEEERDDDDEDDGDSDSANDDEDPLEADPGPDILDDIPFDGQPPFPRPETLSPSNPPSSSPPIPSSAAASLFIDHSSIIDLVSLPYIHFMKKYPSYLVKLLIRTSDSPDVRLIYTTFAEIFWPKRLPDLEQDPAKPTIGATVKEYLRKVKAFGSSGGVVGQGVVRTAHLSMTSKSDRVRSSERRGRGREREGIFEMI